MEVGKVLVISAHTDDMELGCGASVSKYIRQGAKVHSLTFSWCGLEDLKKEHERSMMSIGIDYWSLGDYGVRNFTEARQDILSDLIKVRDLFNPDLVLCPCSFDIHQDHQVVNQEVKRAFKCGIMGYELTWNCLEQNLQFFSEVSEAHMNKKLESLSIYNSQRHRPYFNPDFINGLARVRGVQCGKKYAEAFEVIRCAEYLS